MIKAFTVNSKTILSVDFNRDKTCSQICSYCYVNNMERIYQAYSTKIDKNYNWALSNPAEFAAQLNTEYWKLRNSKAKTWKRLNKLPVRIYGSGDYIPGHYNFLKNLNFKFFIISKTLTLKTMAFQIQALLELTNLTTQESEKKEKNYYRSERMFGSFKLSFTLPAEVDSEKVEAKFEDGMLNISLKKLEPKVRNENFQH